MMWWFCWQIKRETFSSSFSWSTLAGSTYPRLRCAARRWSRPSCIALILQRSSLVRTGLLLFLPSACALCALPFFRLLLPCGMSVLKHPPNRAQHRSRRPRKDGSRLRCHASHHQDARQHGVLLKLVSKSLAMPLPEFVNVLHCVRDQVTTSCCPLTAQLRAEGQTERWAEGGRQWQYDRPPGHPRMNV